jgi:DNA-binding response OmpR family regulator
LARILLVEDKHDVRFLIEHVLIIAGHDIDAAATMEQGINLLRNRSYELVITDAKLPDGTGMAIVDEATEKGIKGLIMKGGLGSRRRRTRETGVPYGMPFFRPQP